MFFVCVAGPTGVGKSDLAVQLGRFMPIEIINGDSAQFYTPFTIGTAKPNWHMEPIRHNLFDSLATPTDFSALQYRDAFVRCAKEVIARGNIPVVVGGSSFYWYSLFYPPLRVHEGVKDAGTAVDTDNVSTIDLWRQLYDIDPIRADDVAKNDRYRIKRALSIWYATGKKPSECKPFFNPAGTCCFVFVTRDRMSLYDRINKRTLHMFEQGWVQEVCALSSEWKNFVVRKGFIGYPEIVDYCKLDLKEQEQRYSALVETVQKHTRRYARKQESFFRRFKDHIALLPERDRASIDLRTVTMSSEGKERALAGCVAHIKHCMERWCE